MGGLVSRRKRSKVEARSVSTQATEKRKAGTRELQVECRAEAATDEALIIEAAVKELKIGDGHTPEPEHRQQQESVFTTRASNENKKRRVKPERPKSSGKKGSTPGIDFSTQYDFLGLPGQVSPGYRSPVKESLQKHRAGKLPNRELGDDPSESVDFGATGLLSPREETTQKTSSRRSPRKKAFPAAQESEDGEAEQDENCNILKEGTLLAELRNSELFGAVPEDELGTTVQQIGNQQRRPSPPGLTRPASGSVDGSPPGDRSPRRQRKKTVTYREDCKPAATVEPPSFGLTEVKPEFRLSLEQILQSNVFYDQETLEVAAVTGTGSARQTLPPPGGYLACWNQAVPLKDGSTGTEPIENDYDPRIEYIDAEPGGEQEQEAAAGEVQEDEDIAEDTLDWNVDDRVRSPSDSRSDSANLSDDEVEDDNVDLLADCSIDVVPPVDGQRQNSLTTLKDGDSAGGSVYSPPARSSPSPNKPATGATDMAQVHTKPGGQTAQATDSKAKTSGLGQDEGPADKTGKLLMNISGKTSDGRQKSLLEMEETEAMTLLLLTGTLPGQEGGGVTRGAGDAKNLDPATGADVSDSENQEADQVAGLAAMQAAPSKASCQLEQLQVEQNQADVNNVVLNDALLPLRATQSPDNSSAAAAQTAHQRQDAAAIRSEGIREMQDGALDGSHQQVLDNARYSGAAACLPDEGDRETLPVPERALSPGAASPEGDWQVIPLRRVPGRIDLGAPAASACPETEEIAESGFQQGAPGTEARQQAAEQAALNESQAAAPTALSQPPDSHEQREDRLGSFSSERAAAEVIVGAGDSPRQKAAVMADQDRATGAMQEEENQNANNASLSTGTQRLTAMSDAQRRSTSKKKRKSGGTGCMWISKN